MSWNQTCFVRIVNPCIQCCQIAAIVVLSRYSVVGFRENAIVTVPCCRLRENHNRGRLMCHGISLRHGCCVASFWQGWIWREIALTAFRVHWFINLKERKPGQARIQVTSAVCTELQFRVVLGLRTRFLALLKLTSRILCLLSEIAERRSFSAVIEQSRGSFRLRVPMKVTDVWAHVPI